jgi:predicted acylesterase/phospholipase RssA
MIPPLRIALSGGGMKGIAHVGALEVLEERGLLKSVKEYLGTSAGALIAFCITLGYTLSELRSLCSVLDFSQTQNINIEDILQFPDTLGLDNGKNIERFLSVLIRAKGFKETITFEEFYAIRPNAPRLRIFATNLDTLSVEEFSIKTPRVPIWLSVRASMSIPLLFTPVKNPETGNFLVDGALISQFPFYFLSDEEKKQSIGICFNIQITKEHIEKYTFITFFINCYHSVYKSHDRDLYAKWGHRIIDINCDESLSVMFNASQEQKQMIMNSGIVATKQFLNTVKHRPVRRYSIP